MKRTCCKKKKTNYKKIYGSDFGELDKLIFDETPKPINETNDTIIKFADKTADDFKKKSKRVGDKLALANKLV